jgi:hypothetical protein
MHSKSILDRTLDKFKKPNDINQSKPSKVEKKETPNDSFKGSSEKRESKAL